MKKIIVAKYADRMDGNNYFFHSIRVLPFNKNLSRIKKVRQLLQL